MNTFEQNREDAKRKQEELKVFYKDMIFYNQTFNFHFSSEIWDRLAKVQRGKEEEEAKAHESLAI